MASIIDHELGPFWQSCGLWLAMFGTFFFFGSSLIKTKVVLKMKQLIGSFQRRKPRPPTLKNDGIPTTGDRNVREEDEENCSLVG